MGKDRKVAVIALVLVAVLVSLAAASLLLNRTPERPAVTYLARAGDTIAFQGIRHLPFEVMGDVTVTIRGEWTASQPTVVTTRWNSFGAPPGWPRDLPKSLGGSIEFTMTFGERNYPNGVGPVSCSLVLYSDVPDSLTAVTDILVTSVHA